MPEDPVKVFLQRMPYGFYSITSRSDDDINVMVANWITQVSFEPRLIAVGLQKKAYSHELIEQGGVFAINLFLKDDKEQLMPYTKSRYKNPDKLIDASFTEAPETGCPILEGAAAYLECQVVKIVDLGADHDILIGQPVGAGIIKDGPAENTLSLLDLGWSYAG